MTSEPLLADGVEIHLEKQESKKFGDNAFCILKTDSDHKTRQWVLPDGLIKSNNQIISIEFDHGITVGKWANQLLKAIRALASDNISGVIYCFCFDKGSSINKLSVEEMTDEFQALVSCNTFDKPVGVLTVFHHELQADPPSKSGVIDFLETTYIKNSGKAIGSKRKAEQIVRALSTIK